MAAGLGSGCSRHLGENRERVSSDILSESRIVSGHAKVRGVRAFASATQNGVLHLVLDSGPGFQETGSLAPIALSTVGTVYLFNIRTEVTRILSEYRLMPSEISDHAPNPEGVRTPETADATGDSRKQAEKAVEARDRLSSL